VSCAADFGAATLAPPCLLIFGTLSSWYSVLPHCGQRGAPTA
jgi:hypothetical protein